MNSLPSSPNTILLMAIVVSVIDLLAGCNRSQNEPDVASTTTNASSLPELSDVQDYEEAIAAKRGKVVLVDFWATWCPPCIEKFPQVVTLYDENKARGLAVIAVSLDGPKARDRVQAILQKNGAAFHNLLSSYESSVKAMEAFDLAGAIPCYRVYDRAGKLQHEFVVDPRADRQFTWEDIELAIAELL